MDEQDSRPFHGSKSEAHAARERLYGVSGNSGKTNKKLRKTIQRPASATRKRPQSAMRKRRPISSNKIKSAGVQRGEIAEEGVPGMAQEVPVPSGYE